MAQNMPGARRSPLKNPPSERAVAIAPNILKTNYQGNPNGGVREKGVARGKRERVRAVQEIIFCLMCGRAQLIVHNALARPEWHRCELCQELQPLDGYEILAFGQDLSMLNPGGV